jgi:hypothetical protein
MVGGGGGAGEEQGDEEGQLSGVQQLRKVLLREELGQQYDPEGATDHLITKSQKNVVENIKKRDHRVGGGIENPKLRSLCIAAYLRCLHASIEYAPTD